MAVARTGLTSVRAVAGLASGFSVPTRALVEQLVKDFHGKQMQDGWLVVKDTSMPVESAQAPLAR